MEKDSSLVVELERTGHERLTQVRSETLNYLTLVAWRTQFRKDVHKFVSEMQISSQLEKDLVLLLKRKYPFRAWLVIARTKTTKQWVTCPMDKLEILEIIVQGEKTLLVLSVPTEKHFNMQSAQSHLRQISSDSAHIMCRSRAKDIFDEMTVSCKSTQLAFVATVGMSDDRSRPLIATSDPKRLAVKRSLRTWWIFCRRYYKSIIFG